MKRSLHSAFALILSISVLLPAAAYSAPEVVSVLYFNNTRNVESLNWLKKGITDMLITDLSNSTGITVVERENLDKVMQEQALSMTGMISEKSSLKVGELLNADTLIMGSFLTSGGVLRIDAKIVNAESGAVKALKVQGREKDIFAIQNNLSDAVCTALGIKKARKTTRETTSQKALTLYYTGLYNLDLGKADKAMELFNRASTIDPLYSGPQQGLEKAYAFLKDFRKMRHQREIARLYGKVKVLQEKRREDPFLTYADLVMSKEYLAMSAAERSAYTKKNYLYYQYQSPAHCTWELSMTLIEIANKEDSFTREQIDRRENVHEEKLGEIRKRYREKKNSLRKHSRKISNEYRDKKKELKKITDSEKRRTEQKKLQAWYNDQKKKIQSEKQKIASNEEKEKSVVEKKLETIDKEKSIQNKNTEKLSNKLMKEVITIARESTKLYKKDKFLPEILYSEILALNTLENYAMVKKRAEYLMVTWPDFRMNWAVENFYEKSLKELKKKE
jgi:TolB-like protein